MKRWIWMVLTAVLWLHAEGIEGQSWNEMEAQSERLYAQGRYQEAAGVLERMLARLQSRRPVDGTRAAVTLNNLGYLYNTLGKYEEAYRYFYQAYNYEQKSVGLQSVPAAKTYAGFAKIFYRAKNDAENAEKYYRTAMDLLIRKLGYADESTIAVAESYATFCIDTKQYEKAERILTKVLRTLKDKFGAGSVKLISPLSTLGYCYVLLDKKEQAKRAFEEAVNLAQRTKEPILAEQIQLNAYIANYYLSIGDFHNAIGALQRAIKLQRRVYGDRHPYTIELQQTLAFVNALSEAAKKSGKASKSTTRPKGSAAKKKSDTPHIAHYPGSSFVGKKGSGESVPIKDLTVEIVKWNDKEKRLALRVWTPQKRYEDLYIFCREKPGYYQCPIEDDGGFVRIDPRMNLQLEVEFAKETEEGMVSELKVVQKEKGKWLAPIAAPAASSPKPKCSVYGKAEAMKIFKRVKRRYPEIPMERIKKINPSIFVDRQLKVSLFAPRNWKDITKEGDAILYLLGGKDEETRKFMLRTLSKFWKKSEENNPRRIITKAAKLMEELSTEVAQKDGDRIKAVGRVKIYEKPNGLMGHFILRRRGQTNRWESYTLIWAGKKLYLLGVMSPKKELLMGEFLSALGAESFCSRGE